MVRRLALCLLVAGLGVGLGGRGATAAEGDARKCFEETEAAVPRVDPCTRAIESGAHAPEKLALIYYNRGVIRFRNGALVRAIEDYSTAIRLAPRFAPAYNNRCHLHTLERRYDLALADCERAVALVPRNPFMLESRGFVRLRMGRHAEAIADFDAAIEIKPDYDLAYYHRALAHDVLGERERALADYRQAYALRPDNGDYRAVMRTLGLLD